MQNTGLAYPATYHQAPTSTSWPNAQPGFAPTGPPGQSVYNHSVPTHVTSSNAYNNQLTYAAELREGQYEGHNSHHGMAPPHSIPQGALLHSQPLHPATGEFHPPQQFRGPANENTQLRPHSNCMPRESSEGQSERGVAHPSEPVHGGLQREMPIAGCNNGVCATPRADEEASNSAVAASALRRLAVNPTSFAHTTSGIGALHDQHDSTMEQMQEAHTSNSQILLSSNSSKSSPPYTLSQRKQLRVEEKLYLKEVKRSIAEGRVPQVRLQQNNNGDIVQYKSQFLNALKLAALSIVIDADIDTKNTSTIQEIMIEVRRQFIIEKPLPEGMVEGFLQRLYKRNRAVYHCHWTQHGDERKPDDCSLAAWSQLVDYWKSKEGNKECERNKTNASAKKKHL